MTATIAPTSWIEAPRSDDAEGARATTGAAGDQQPDDDERDRPARQRPPGRLRRDLELDLDLVRQGGRQLADPPVERRAAARRPARRTGSGFGDGWVVASGGDLLVDLDGLAVALVALLGGVALGHEPLGLAGLLEQAAPLGQRGLGVGAPLASGRQGVAVALELGQRQLALLDRRLRPGRRPARRP